MKVADTKNPVWEIIARVPDPEVPVLTVLDLGIVRHVELEGKEIRVTITPTYTGCPAMDMIGANIRKELKKEGFEKIEVKLSLTPAWTTDWLSEEGKKKLKEYGIAPPVGATTDKRVLIGEFSEVTCPRCESENTHMISQFGSTACKALYQCKDCMEPFDYFKCH
ncbi:MAG: phenylacetate-CoA oxygenase subunit PaaJ [Bacteroidia bacterium]|nr:phenylacetate-CoA oxygenase subunit PaaJ [Bacteroidia bacterium]